MCGHEDRWCAAPTACLSRVKVNAAPRFASGAWVSATADAIRRRRAPITAPPRRLRVVTVRCRSPHQRRDAAPSPLTRPAPQDDTSAPSPSAATFNQPAERRLTPPPLDEKFLAATLRERGVSTAFFAVYWRKYSDAQSHSCISEADARRFLGDVADQLDLRLEQDTYAHLIETCKSVGTCVSCAS